jgi:hypothetical protein
MVVHGLSSLRGAAFNFKLLSGVLNNGLPTWTVIQNWIFRFGLHQLLKPLPTRSDWIWVIDHTIEFGTKKCLVILAVSHEVFNHVVFRDNTYNLRHEDMQVARINITENATGEQVADVLKELKEETGSPAQIVSDNGSNIKKGVRIFCKETPSTIHTYDITHKIAILLKHLLKDDERWKLFTQRISETKRRCVHTVFVSLAPKKPREKARWLNLEDKVLWAENILCCTSFTKFKRGRPSKKSHQQKEKFKDVFGWVKDFEEDITKWRTLLNVLNEAKDEVKFNGLSQKTSKNFQEKIKDIDSQNVTAKELKNELISFFQEETKMFDSDKKWLGTSDIIESIFGKYKIFSEKTPMTEIGKTILTIPVLVSKVSLTDVKEAMESISNRELNEWIKNNLGETLFSKRKKAFINNKTKNGMKYFLPKLKKTANF